MPQELISQFDRKIAMPIETFRQVQTINLRDAIPTNIRWEGMIVYVISESLSYVLVGGLSNSQWVDLGTLVNVTVRDNLTSTSTTDALSANQGRILKGLIDNIPVGVDWGDIGGTLSDQTDLQSALNSKENTITGGATTITSSNLTANRALISNGSGKVAVSAVTNTEIGYLDGVTSAIQTQINGKYTTPSGTTSQYVRGDGSLATFPTIPTVPVSSVFGRTGAITAQNNDYTFAQIGSKPTTIAGYGITDAYTKAETDGKYLLRTTDTLTGTLGVSSNLNIGGYGTFAGGGGNAVRIYGSNTGDSNVGYYSIYESNGSTNRGRFGFLSGSNSHLQIENVQSQISLRLAEGGGINGLQFVDSGGAGTVWTSRNDGAGSGLDADLLDGIDSGQFARLGNLTHNNTYLFLNRNSTSGATLHVNQEGTNDIANFRKAGAGSTSNSVSVVIDNSANIIATGSTTALSFKTANWEIVETGGVLQFKQGGVTRFQVDASGNGTFSGNITAN